MTQKLEIYKCELCGNIIEITHGGNGTLTCCGKEMMNMKENTVEAAKEKHIPILTKNDNGYEVKVGEVEHPSEEAHYIEWIELILSDNRNLKKYINAGEQPIIQINPSAEIVKVRAYCNLHGLWKA